nr:hypothetical protein [Saprospiraceae bacterium]
HKQFLYEGGLHIPLIVADFRQNAVIESGTKNDELVSGLDLAPSSLSLAGLATPTYMTGIDVFDPSHDPREYVIGTRDRCDFTIDRIRSVRTEHHRYIRNFLTDRPYMQPTYMDVDSVPVVLTMKSLYRSGALDPVQARFFEDHRPSEELYDLRSDPHQIHNLAQSAEHQRLVVQHRTILDRWIQDSGDLGMEPESTPGLRLMLGIWGKHAINPEYAGLRLEEPELAGSLYGLKQSGWQSVE